MVFELYKIELAKDHDSYRDALHAAGYAYLTFQEELEMT